MIVNKIIREWRKTKGQATDNVKNRYRLCEKQRKIKVITSNAEYYLVSYLVKKIICTTI